MIQKVSTAESTIDWLIFRGRIAEGFAEGSRKRAERGASAAAAATAATATKEKTPQRENSSCHTRKDRGSIAEGWPDFF